MFDILIIGAGITGVLIARELSKYNLKIALLDKENDVGNKTTSSNSAIIHSGYDPLPGSLKAKFNVLGNKKFDQLAEELDVSFSRVGSLTVALYDEQIPLLKELALRSEQNGVEVSILSKDEVLKIEPHMNPEVKGALLAKSAGIIDPFNFCVHACENAIDNGVNLFLNQEVINIKKDGDYYIVKSQDQTYQTKIVINAAGCYSDKIASMVEDISWRITPKKGQYFVLDYYEPGLVNHVIFPLPSEKGKGILVTMTTANNYLIGPSSDPLEDKDDYSTDKFTLDEVKRQASNMVKDIPFNRTVRVFAGLRPTPSTHDFIIGYSKNDKHFINVAGIESPGLVSSPAIAEYVVNELVKPIINCEENKDFNPYVKKYFNSSRFFYTEENKEQIIKENPDYGEMICNCEKVSLGEIKDVLSRSCPPHSIKGLKRRTRAGFGKCQGGFCQPKVTLLLAKHYGVSPLDVPYDNKGSEILLEEIKEVK